MNKKPDLSRRVDRFRPPYGRCVKEFPRRGVICGSTNQQEFLNDPTGSRRFWIIPTGSRPIDIETLRRERDAIWAAAVQAYRAGEQWWLTPDEHNQSEELNLEYQQSDPWMDIIQGNLSLPSAPSQLTTEYILTEWLSLPKDRQGKAEQRRVGAIMRGLGYDRTRRRDGDDRQYYWQKICQGKDSKTIGDIGDSERKNGSGTELEGVPNTLQPVPNETAIGDSSVPNGDFIGDGLKAIGDSPKAPPLANFGVGVPNVPNASTQITLEQKSKRGDGAPQEPATYQGSHWDVDPY